jgi:molecular chaperone GrpE
MNTETEPTVEQAPADPAAETSPETPAPDAAASEAPASESSSTDVATLQAEIEKFKDAALRARAEFDNYRKRMAREKEESLRYANAGLLEDLLPVLDNFELGLEAARNSPEAAGIVQGFEMVRKQLEDFLRNQGVEVVDAVGKEFDHNLHDAVGQEASPDVPEGVVLRQLRRGFKLRDRLLRPASVIVSKGAA